MDRTAPAKGPIPRRHLLASAVLIVCSLALVVLVPPFGVALALAVALHAHFAGLRAVRNVALLVALLGLAVVLFSGVGGSSEGGLTG